MENGEIIIDKDVILPGESKEVNIRVSRLPSGTRINIWAHVYRSTEPGPTVLILAGVHGDEINGIEIVRRSMSGGIFERLTRGTAIIIPLLNVYGFINYTREVPDGRDVNRSFPGSVGGSLASRVAGALTRKILPHVHYAIDFHTGGSSRYNFPQVRFSKRDEVAAMLASEFGAPFLVEKAPIPKSFRKTATDMGIPVIIYEAGESERLCGYAIEMGVQGLRRIFKFLQMTDEALEPNHARFRVKSTGWVRAPEAGLFTWSKPSGHKIHKGEPLGVIHSPQGERSRRILARRDGYIIGHNNASVVHTGDALFHMAYEFQKL